MPVQFTPRNNQYELQRRQLQANQLRQQATNTAPQLGTTAPGGIFVPENNLNRVAHLLRTYSADKAQRGANEYAQGLYRQDAQDRGALIEALRNQDPMTALSDMSDNPVAQDMLIQAYSNRLNQAPSDTYQTVVDEQGNPLYQVSSTGEVSAHPMAPKPYQSKPTDLVVPDPNNPGQYMPNQPVIDAKTRIAEAGGTKIENIMGGQMTPGQEAIDKEFAKSVYVPFVSGGSADAAKNLNQLKWARDQLGKSQNLTGPIVGNVPDAVQAFINPDAVNTREAVEEVVQRNLREVLGAQFTEREGERLIARAYNPKLSEEQNIQRLNRLIDSIEQAYNQKNAAVQYFQQNRSLAGYQYQPPTIADFDRVIDEMDASIKTELPPGWSVEEVQ